MGVSGHIRAYPYAKLKFIQCLSAVGGGLWATGLGVDSDAKLHEVLSEETVVLKFGGDPFNDFQSHSAGAAFVYGLVEIGFSCGEGVEGFAIVRNVDTNGVVGERDFGLNESGKRCLVAVVHDVNDKFFHYESHIVPGTSWDVVVEKERVDGLPQLRKFPSLVT